MEVMKGLQLLAEGKLELWFLVEIGEGSQPPVEVMGGLQLLAEGKLQSK